MQSPFAICRGCDQMRMAGARLQCPLIAATVSGGEGDVLPWFDRGKDCPRAKWPRGRAGVSVRDRSARTAIDEAERKRRAAAIAEQRKIEERVKAELELRYAGQVAICRAGCTQHFVGGGWDRCRRLPGGCSHCRQRIVIALRDGKECPEERF